jgi:hypothetical protein
MGGNALAEFGARRHSKEEYWAKVFEIDRLLRLALPNHEFWEIPSYRSKETFGDLDLLTDPLTEPDYEAIKQALGNGPFVRNSGVMSILYKELQVDIIPMPEEEFNTAFQYYAFNDLGNLLGKLFHKFGLKYGHRGLTLPLRDGDHKFQEIRVSDSLYEIYSFLGLESKRWITGFDTLEEIYEFVCSSKYFSTEPYKYENLNHTNRIRDRKRTTYHGFLEYIKTKESKFVFNEDKDVYLPIIFAFFPGTEAKYKKAHDELDARKASRDKFNGNLVSEWTGLKSLYLGKFMRQFKERYPDFDTLVEMLPHNKVKALVLDYYLEFNNFQRMSTMDWDPTGERLKRVIKERQTC